MKPISFERICRVAGLFGAAKENLAYHAGGHGPSDGVLYRFTKQGREHLLKVLEVHSEKPEDLAKIGERIRFMHYLRSQGTPVVFPVPSCAGNLYEEVRDGESVLIGYTMEMAAGKPADSLSGQERTAFLERWGALIGKMHACARTYPVWNGIYPADDGPLTLHWGEEWRFFHGWLRDDQVRSVWERVRSVLETLPVERDGFGFIHNDPHMSNVLIDGDKLTILDFDVSNCHWFMTDIAIALSSFLFANRNEDKARVRSLFMERFFRGYEQENRLASVWLERLDLFLLYRAIVMFAVFYDQMQGKPAALQRWKEHLLREASHVLG